MVQQKSGVSSSARSSVWHGCAVERSMRRLGLRGVTHGKAVHTSIANRV